MNSLFNPVVQNHHSLFSFIEYPTPKHSTAQIKSKEEIIDALFEKLIPYSSSKLREHLETETPYELSEKEAYINKKLSKLHSEKIISFIKDNAIENSEIEHILTVLIKNNSISKALIVLEFTNKNLSLDFYQQLCKELNHQNDEIFNRAIRCLPTISLKNKVIANRTINLIEKKHYPEAIDFFLEYFTIQTTNPLDSLHNENYIGKIVKKLIRKEAYNEAVTLLQKLINPWQEHTNIFANGFFELIKALLKKDDQLKIDELINLIPGQDKSNQTTLQSIEGEKELPNDAVSDNFYCEQDTRSNKIFLIITKLIKQGDVKFKNLEKLINKITNEDLKFKCHNKIVDIILNYINKFVYKLNDIKFYQNNNPLENGDSQLQLPPETLFNIFDFLDEKSLANLSLSNHHLKKWVNDYYRKEIKLLKSFILLAVDFCILKNDYSIIGSIFDLINHRSFQRVQDQIITKPGFQIKSIYKSKKFSPFKLIYKIANLFKNMDCDNLGIDFLEFKNYIGNQNLISNEESIFFKQLCDLIDFCINLKRLTTHWKEKDEIYFDYSIHFHVEPSHLYTDLKISENLRYIYYLLMHHPRYHDSLLIYLTIHSLLQINQIDKAKKLAKFLPRYQVKSFFKKLSDSILSNNDDDNAKTRRQITEIALFEIYLAEKKFDKAYRIIEKIVNHESEYLFQTLCHHDFQNKTSSDTYEKEIYRLFADKLLEENSYEYPLKLVGLGKIEPWEIEGKVYDKLLATKQSIEEIKRVADFFPKGQSKNEFLCKKAKELIKDGQIQNVVNLILRKVKLNLDESIFGSVSALSDVIEILLKKDHIDESIEILYLIPQEKEKNFSLYSFEIIFRYLLQHDKEKLRGLIKAINNNISLKVLGKMINFQLDWMSKEYGQKMDKEAEEAATLIKLLPSKDKKQEYTKKLVNFLNEKNHKDLAIHFEYFILHKKNESKKKRDDSEDSLILD